MLTKKEIKDIQSLCHKKQREEEGLFVAEGPKLAAEIINSDIEIKMVYATAQWRQNNPGNQLPFTEINDTELERISNLQTPNEVLVVAKQTPLPGEPELQHKLTIVLDGIQDPGNMGTIIRTADWFGLSQIICSHDCADLYNPKVVQATMGSIARVRCWYKNLDEWDMPPNIPIYGALLDGQNVFLINKITEGILVIGNESKGIREPLLSQITHPVTIPKYGNAESLNVAVAAGIIMGQMAAHSHVK